MTSSATKCDDTGLTNEPETGSGAQESRLTDGPELVQAVQLPFTMPASSLSSSPPPSLHPPLLPRLLLLRSNLSTPPETGSPCIRIRDYRPRVRPVKLILCALALFCPSSKHRARSPFFSFFSPFFFFSSFPPSLLRCLRSSLSLPILTWIINPVARGEQTARLFVLRVSIIGSYYDRKMLQ